ncbi:MAG TPA: glycosyltransferase [Actinomycetales bacterium]
MPVDVRAAVSWRRLRRLPVLAHLLPAARAAVCVPASAQALWRWRSGAPLDPGWYAEQGPAGRAPLLHYLLVGRREGWSPHPLLEPSWLAPTSWRRPFPEPLAATTGRPGHPVLTAAVDVCGLRPATEVPTSAGPVPYGRLRDAAVAGVRLRDEQERLRTLPRVRGQWAPGRPVEVVSPPVLPSVTVVMPVRDRPVQVLEALASVQAQTHPQWQLVVVDDGSTDSTPDVVAAVAARDPRVQLVRAHHGGVSAARNLGAEHATGDVLAWLDSDNTWLPGHLGTMLTFLAVTGAESAYAALEQDTDHGVRYRALDAGWAALRLQNHVDLNVLVARRAAVEEVGGFDPTLRRAVDYDLVLRLARRSVPAFVPALGARYDERRGAADRITVREARTWSDVVRARRLVDWPALALAERDEGRLCVVVPVPRTTTLAELVPTLRDALALPGDVEVVAVDAGGSRATASTLAVLVAADPRLTVLRWPAPMTPGWALAHALPEVGGALLAVVDAGTRLPTRSELPPHAAALIAEGLLVARTADVVAVGGADAQEAGAAWRADLAQRLSASTGRPVIEPGGAPAE